VIVLHPKFVEKSGIGDIVRYFQVRGFAVTNCVGSRFYHLIPHEHVRELSRTLLDDIQTIFKPAPQKRR
jgi:nucleoside diphosphate kinase